jgi:DUF971 family protein
MRAPQTCLFLTCGTQSTILLAFPVCGLRSAALGIKSATMVLEKSKTLPRIRGLNEVGRYAIGIQWTDGHESIFPLENLRRGCPCNTCAGAIEGDITAPAQRLVHFSRLGEVAVYLEWLDGHETLYTTVQLRQLCRCALCVQEPERPITGH